MRDGDEGRPAWPVRAAAWLRANAARIAGVLVLVVVAAGAAVLSYHGLTDLARRAGVPADLVAFLPIVFDAGAAGGTLAARQAATEAQRRAGWVGAQVLLALSTIANAVDHVLIGMELRLPWWLVAVGTLLLAAPPGVLAWTLHLVGPAQPTSPAQPAHPAQPNPVAKRSPVAQPEPVAQLPRPVAVAATVRPAQVSAHAELSPPAQPTSAQTDPTAQPTHGAQTFEQLVVALATRPAERGGPMSQRDIAAELGEKSRTRVRTVLESRGLAGRRRPTDRETVNA